MERPVVDAERSMKVWAGLAVGLGLIALWGTSLAVFLRSPLPAWPLALVAVAWQTWLYTGLFITGHEAMHGLVAPGRARLNHAIGAIAVRLFALFSYRRLRECHAAHHQRPCSERDPDFHDGRHVGFWRWYVRFFSGYASIGQIAGMALVFNLLARGLHVSQANLLLFWVAPSLLSSLQLFYFGTFRPHRAPAGGYRGPHFATSSEWPVVWSLLSCYHFGYHWEHHAYPAVPWWRLPALRTRLRAQGR